MNLAMLLDMAADGLGDRVAIGSRDGGITYEGLRRAASAAAARLDGTGATSLVLTLPNGPVLPVALFGAAWAGVSYAPVNFRLPDAVRKEMIERLQPAVVIDDETAWLAGAAAEGELRAFPDDPDRPAVLLFTSGTSAAPKAAVLAHDQLLAYIFNTVEFAAAGDDEAVLLAVPPFHIAGVAAVLSSTYAGRRIVPLPRFTAEDWIVTARDEQVTHAFVVPTMLARIVAAMEADESLRVPTLRHLAYGGARTPAPVLERALHLFPATGFVNAYGLTETSSTVSVLGPDDHRAAHESDDPAVKARLSSVGRPVPGIEVIVVADDGAECAPNEKGEVRIRGAQVSGEYVGVQSQRDRDGWLHTGDRGWLDAEGYLFVEGRGDDTIIRGGENLSPAEIEDTLLRHPAVGHAAVVGLPDEEWGEKVAAMVTPVPGATIDVEELQAWTREHLGSIKTPEVVALADELPHTATGKILRRQIRQELAEQ
ncbi:MAG TPA: fatty acid--CoA ligase family protein [Acidimicrobiia bacterium]|nr:fatty acid--CoA ligase family protein [Acidimicrobiia bacterium]